MSGTVTVTESASGDIQQITFAWTSDASGNATATTTQSYAGQALTAVFTPGSPTPTTLYDVTINDVGTVDILGGAGANLTVTGAVVKQTADGLTSIVTEGVLALSVTNAGNAKQGTVIIYITGATNAYCTLQQVKNRLSSDPLKPSATDDAVLYEMIAQASRAIDAFCGGRTFYARTGETRYYDATGELQIDLDDDLLALTSVTNGDGTTVSAASYNLIDLNTRPYYAIEMKTSASILWLPSTVGDYRYAIALTGTWGYVDRTATDARSILVIRNTEHATMETVVAIYKARYGDNTSNTTIVTPSGTVITPRDIPTWAQSYIKIYRRGP